MRKCATTVRIRNMGTAQPHLVTNRPAAGLPGQGKPSDDDGHQWREGGAFAKAIG